MDLPTYALPLAANIASEIRQRTGAVIPNAEVLRRATLAGLALFAAFDERSAASPIFAERALDAALMFLLGMRGGEPLRPPVPPEGVTALFPWRSPGDRLRIVQTSEEQKEIDLNAVRFLRRRAEEIEAETHDGTGADMRSAASALEALWATKGAG